MSETRPCPVCAGVARRILHRQRFQDGPLGNGYDVVVCQACGAGFADGIPAQDELDRYYAEQSKYTYDHAEGAESPYDIKRFKIIADQVIPFLPSHDARILDIGCATGGLLSVFKQHGFSNVLGIDPSPVCAEAARRLHGVEVRVATLAQLAGWHERFDLVLMVGVLEHLREVQPAVRAVVARLNPGGLFYGAVPDVEGLAACHNAPYQQFSVEHVNFFSGQSLGRLMAVCGLTPRQTWQQMVEWREDITEPIVSGIYSLTPSGEVPSSKLQVPREHNASPSSAVRPSLSPSSAVGAAAKLRRSEDGSPSLQVDRATAPALERYVALCREQDEKLYAIIERLVRSQEPILVWGGGTLTRRLLATSRLAEANIVGFVDSNPGIQGHRLADREIFSPTQIAGRNEAIMVCSKAFEREIVRMIRDQLHLTNPVILLG